MEINDIKKANMNPQVKSSGGRGVTLRKLIFTKVFSGSQLQTKTLWKYLSQKSNKTQVTSFYPTFSFLTGDKSNEVHLQNYASFPKLSSLPDAHIPQNHRKMPLGGLEEMAEGH